MTENFKIARQHRKLETNMNVPQVDSNLHVRTLRSRNIAYDIRHRQIDNQTARREKLNIPPQPNNLETSSKEMTFDISTHLPSNKDVTISSTVRQEHIQVPTPNPRSERYIRQDKSSISPPQTYPYDQSMRDRNDTIQPKLSHFSRDTLSYNRREHYEMYEDLTVDIDVSEQISYRLHRMAKLMRKSK